MKKKKLQLPWYHRLILWLLTPARKYMAYRFKVAITKDIAIAEAALRQRKPHWTDEMVKKRARLKYVEQLRMIGA